MKIFTGIYVKSGSVRRITLEADTIEEARELGAKWDVGIEGETAELTAVLAAAAIPPEAYDLPTARRLLGNVGRSTVYRELAVGGLERVPGTNKVLITRKSLEARCRAKKRPFAPC